MKYGFKTINSLFTVVAMLTMTLTAYADSIPSAFSRPPEWMVGAELSPAYVPGTNNFLKGDNPQGKRISTSFAGDIRAAFRFNSDTKEGMLYPGLYQGIGVGANTFFNNELLGNPVSVYVFQGAPIAHLGRRLWLGYEWQFGAALGWKHFDKDEVYSAPVSTMATAHMGIALKMHYALSERWNMSFGISAHHFSNGNTTLPNSGVNRIGAVIGLAYVLNPQKDNSTPDPALIAEYGRGRWFYDIMAYGAWRRRIVSIGEPAEAQLCPGKFGVAGIQFAPMRQLGRYVAVGPSLDLQWDESAALDSYWIDGSYGENIKFERPPFGKQISAGLSAHAELTMPVFAVNAGLGFNIVSPEGEKRFYQSLTLKTFVTQNLFLNVGYRLGNFKEPQNLMLGIGVRI